MGIFKFSSRKLRQMNRFALNIIMRKTAIIFMVQPKDMLPIALKNMLKINNFFA